MKPKPDPSQDPAAGEARASVNRALAILDLFSAEHPSWSVDQISEALQVAAPTAYRYVRELLSAGLLTRLSGGLYALGPRIILLDYRMRQVDPLLRAAPAIMRDLVRRTGCDCVTSALYGDQILDTHRETGNEMLALAYGRGRPRPLFQGAAPKVIVAAQNSRWQRKLHEARGAEIAAAGMGQSWPEFRSALRAIAKRGYYVSRGELEPQLASLAAPILVEAPDPPIYAIALVTSAERFDLLNLPMVTKLVLGAAAELAVALRP